MLESTCRNYVLLLLATHGLLGNPKRAKDHNRDGMLERAASVYSDQEVAAYVWGLAYHWHSAAKGRPKA